MLYYLSAAGLVLHTVFWGAGLSGLIVPRRWRRWWWAWAPGLGLALQSAVVWAGAHAGFAGTNTYALPSEVLPLGLLVAALWRGGRAQWLRGWRGAAGTVLLAALAGWMLLSPMTKVTRGLTTTSLGSCDHADYAAGARVFQEFSNSDRAGFLGLPEVTRVRSAEYFFDFWLRINHFTPSALLAHNGTILGAEPRRLISVTAAVLVLLNLPVVLLLARLVAGVRGWLLAGVVALYAFSPLQAYAVHHGALGQLHAAQGIALLTVAVVLAGRDAAAGRGAWSWLGVMLAALWILAGSYNFILTVCLAPAGMWLVVEAARRRNAQLLWAPVAVLAAAAVLLAVGFWGRLDGLVERFSLFEQYNFGWAVPLLSPEGWLGAVRDTLLGGWAPVWRWVAGGLLTVLALRGFLAGGPGRARAVGAASLVLPVVAGWALLAWESRVRANASYDAYKILSVFHPGLVAGLCGWLVLERRSAAWRAAIGTVLVLLLGATLHSADLFRVRMATPVYRVDRSLVELQAIERDPAVASLNMRIEDFWARLWANSFLLRKPQYFVTHTYEGRLDTPLRGEWDLTDNPIRVHPVAVADFKQVNRRFHLVRVQASGYFRAQFADGWHDAERLGDVEWRWSRGDGRVHLVNESGRPIRVRLRAELRVAAPARVEARLAEQTAGAWEVGTAPGWFDSPPFLVPPGLSVLALRNPPTPPGTAGDGRALGVAVLNLELRALPQE